VDTNEIRKKFLEFFKAKGHTLVPSSPTVPLDDPTLLFTNAGMNQFKDVFLGSSKREYTTAATSQKCIRVGGKHNDLDNVGHTTRHMTFFEMMGNFSFGDYFKERAIALAWELVVDGFNFPVDKLWISVFEKDDESFELWKKHVDEKRIVRIGEKDNFWAMGDVGPCGPCSEIFFDRGESYGKATSPADDPDGERFLEFWNLVFMQYNRDASGKMAPLPAPSVDTGAGLERVAMLLQGVDNVFQTDVLMSLIREIEKRFKIKYEVNPPAFHVIADHLRTLAFAIADGAQPSNVDRGYVLRKVLRRAVRYGRLLGIEKPFLSTLLPELCTLMGAHYGELKTSLKRSEEILQMEEESFITTLRRGGNILSSVIEKSKRSKEISGEDAFKLKDTYGFPIEEILLIAKDSGLRVNLDAYTLLEQKAKDLSRSAHKAHAQMAEENIFDDFVETHGLCEFSGYDEIESESRVIAILKDSAFVNRLSEGEEGLLFLDNTPFYAEKGGQVGDQGVIEHQGASFHVSDTRAGAAGVIAHVGQLERGTLLVGEPVKARVHASRRHAIENHHTATHLLHFALQQVLGEHIRQAGSLVASDHLRFDFNHHKNMSREEIRQIEQMVNEMIHRNIAVKTYQVEYAQVQKMPEIKQFFGDKYGDVVRVVDMGESKELCGGTHAPSTARLGLFRITKESSIAKGVRRIEASVGKMAEKFMYETEDVLHRGADTLGTPLAKFEEALQNLANENKDLKTRVKQIEQKQRSALAQTLAKKGPVIAELIDCSVSELAPLANELIEKVADGALMLATSDGERCHIAIRLSSTLVKGGLDAGTLIREIVPLIDGSGGGKKGAAQGGGKNKAGIPDALDKFKALLKKP